MYKYKDVLLKIVIYEEKILKMRKWDIEYSTQYTPEKEYLLSVGIKPTFVKVINEITTYKYKKNKKLFEALAQFYK